MQTEQTPDAGDYRGIPARALRTRRAQFLAEADRLFPWQAWANMIEPHYPKRGKGRPPYPLPALLRLYLLQQWFNLSDLAAQEVATDSIAVRRFMGLPLTWDKTAPDESTLLHFRRLLTRRGLAAEIAADASAALPAKVGSCAPARLPRCGYRQSAPDNRGSFLGFRRTGNANPGCALVSKSLQGGVWNTGGGGGIKSLQAQATGPAA
jgi:hypothetical protein